MNRQLAERVTILEISVKHANKLVHWLQQTIIWSGPNNVKVLEAVHISNENEGFAPILTSPELGSYTAEQKGYFDQLITNADALGMYTFQCTCDQSVFTNLYNSFEKGSVTKYKKIVGDLIARGSAVMLDCVSAITDAIEAGDDAGVLEVLEGMHPDTEQIIRDRLAQEHVAEFARIAKVAA
jgi:hypothetical protein